MVWLIGVLRYWKILLIIQPDYKVWVLWSSQGTSLCCHTNVACFVQVTIRDVTGNSVVGENIAYAAPFIWGKVAANTQVELKNTSLNIYLLQTPIIEIL